jgi:hypothetical protein
MICFQTKPKLEMVTELVRSRKEPPFDVYLSEENLKKFTNSNPYEAWVVKKTKTIGFDSIHKEWFDKGVPDDLLLTFPCNDHEICVKCLRAIVTDYTCHPINHEHSHMTCMYPFDNCYEKLPHHYLAEILTHDQFIRYLCHAEKFEFPGYEKVKCPGKYWSHPDSQFIDCSGTILVNIAEINKSDIGDLVIYCRKGSGTGTACFGNFCYHCKKNLSFFQETCSDCKMKNENTNENSYNYFFNTPFHLPECSLFCSESDISNDWCICHLNSTLRLFRNSEITFEIATTQLINLIDDINTFYICPICKIPMERTEKCNGVSHHDIERCYVCGRIGQEIRGLVDHWNQRGIGGCYRFSSDTYITENFNYQCLENLCFNHEIGECAIPEHQPALISIQIDRKKAFLLHSINSLLPTLRFKVLDYLVEKYQGTPNEDLLPKKSTLLFLMDHPERYLDYSECIILHP